MKKLTLLVSLALVLGLVMGCPDPVTPEPSGDYTVTVVGGTGSGSYDAGESVSIKATTPDYQIFNNWSASSSSVIFANANASETSFIMPAQNVTITAEVTDTSKQVLAVAEVVGGTELKIRAATEGAGSTLRNAMESVTLSDAVRDAITTITIVNPQGGRKIVAEADLSNLFSRAVYPNLTTISGEEYIDTSNVTNMSEMFYGLRFTNLDLSTWNTSNVTNMDSMFSGSGLTNLDLSTWNTSNVTNMDSMFSNSSLTHLNVANWNTAKVTSADGMFDRRVGTFVSLLEVTVGGNLTEIVFSQIRAKDGEFNGNFYAGKWQRDAYTGDTIELKNGKTVAGTYRAMIFEPTKVKASFSGTTLTIRVDEASGVSLQEAIETVGDPNKASIQTITIEKPANNAKIIPEQWMNFMFSNYSALRTINGLEHIDTSMVTNMYKLFFDCSSLTSLDLSSWNTDEVTGMSSMFYNCSALETLNVSTWTTPKLIDMESMFYNCRALESVDLSKWQANLRDSQENMFVWCSNLTSLNLRNIKTDNVTSMWQMFAACNALTSLDISGWNTTKVTNATDMFYSGERDASNNPLPIPLRKSAITSNGATFNDVVRAQIDTLAD